jgi:hypothetical protein
VKSLDFRRYALSSCVAAAMLVGCGGSQPPIGAPGAMPQTSAIATHVDRGKSWMLPEAAQDDLLYAANANANTVSVYSYSKRGLVGTLDAEGPAGECVDKDGDVYVTEGTNILEYAHGGTQPIATLNIGGDNAWACSVDFKSGALAVADFGNDYSTGFIAVFKNGVETTYTTSSIYYVLGCGYDDHGNLLIGGYVAPGNYSNLAFAMLSRGRNNLTSVALPFEDWPNIAAIQWDGSYWAAAVPIQHREEIMYRFSIENQTAKLEGKTLLSHDAGYAGQTWIIRRRVGLEQRTRIVGAVGPAGEVEYWNYPSGKRFASISDSGYPLGVTVSLAPH